MCEVSKCEFRLPIDVLFVLFSWASSLHSPTSFPNGGGRSGGPRELGVGQAESWNKNCQFANDFPMLCI